MKVLLLNPPGPYCRAGSRWPHSRKVASIGIDYHPFPFGLAYAASRLRTDGHEVRLVDCIANAVDDAELARIDKAFDADVVIMETSAPSFRADVATMQQLGRPCIAVGAHATATWREHVEAGYRAVVCGEYDQVVSDAVTLHPTPWLAAKQADPTDFAPLAENLDAIPYPAWDLMDMNKYNDPICLGRSVTLLSSRGCPYKCSFCTLAPYHGDRNYRLRSAASVCDEIAELIKRYRPDEIYFDDDTITANKSHALKLFEEYRHRGFNLPFCCMGNATVAPEVLEAMAAAGCRAYKFGVESADEEVLRQIPKDMDLGDVRRTVDDCRRLGIQTHATFVFGLPGETRQSALQTIDYALKLRPHTLQFAIATPYPGTALYFRAQKEGWLVKDNWQDFDPSSGAVLSYPGYSTQEIERVHEEAWRRWQWHMLTRRPGTLFHHFRNAFKREGFSGLIHLGRYSVGRLIKILRGGT